MGTSNSTKVNFPGLDPGPPRIIDLFFQKSGANRLDRRTAGPRSSRLGERRARALRACGPHGRFGRAYLLRDHSPHVVAKWRFAKRPRTPSATLRVLRPVLLVLSCLLTLYTSVLESVPVWLWACELGWLLDHSQLVYRQAPGSVRAILTGPY